jgi:lipopolysaccharide/colanic/teichoic acid biosynthesis glycosyltransferase
MQRDDRRHAVSDNARLVPGMQDDGSRVRDEATGVRAGLRREPVLAKRVLDIAVGSIALLLLLPLMVVIAVAVKLTSRGPTFYQWHVIGKNGRPFVGYKFRSMVVDAEELKSSLLAHNEMTGPVFKMTLDPRVTPVGRFIRKFSIDEFPQLWSVLKGDMSLVGPRPVSPYEWRRFEPWQRRKLSVTPGMICLWHVNGTPKDFDQWVRMDLEYIDTWSIWLDLKILAKGALYIVLGRSR